MFTFSQFDTYKISPVKKDVKFIVDYKVLVRLYEPIIGSIAMSLYLTLESEISLNKHTRTSINIARLHKLLQITEKKFNDYTPQELYNLSQTNPTLFKQILNGK